MSITEKRKELDDLAESIDDFKQAIKDLEHIKDYMTDSSTYRKGLPKQNVLALYDLNMTIKLFKRKLKSVEKRKEIMGNN